MESSTQEQKSTLGIFIGVSNYESIEYGGLPACEKDVTAMKTVISKLKGIKKPLFLTNEKSSVVKDKLIDFIQENKGKKIDEVFFYFSGHGERIGDEYYYVLSDFQKEKKNSTGLQESFLDGIVRELNPKTFTKVVDACFSGTKYIKDSHESKQTQIKLSVEKSSFEQVYYFFSSRDNQASYADRDGMSYFTDQFISSLLSAERDARYIELSKELSDLFVNNPENQQPIFVMQGSYLDGFGKITEKVITLLMKEIGIASPTDTPEREKEEEKKADSLESRLMDAIEKSKENCVTQEKIANILSNLAPEITKSIPAYIKKAFKVTVENKKIKDLENKEQIGEWLIKKNSLYAVPAYDSKTVITQEYVKPEKISVPVPETEQNNDFDLFKTFSSKKNPSSAFARAQWLSMKSGLHFEPKEPRLEERVLKEIKKRETYISGFHYRCNDEFNILCVTMEPLHQLLPKIDYWVVFIYSHKEFFVHYSYASVQKKSWSEYESPEKRKWSAMEIKNISKTGPKEIAEFFIKRITEIIDGEVKKINQA